MNIKLSQLHWGPATIFIVGLHCLALVALPAYLYLHPPAAVMLWASLVALLLTEIGIGGAYHRFYSHLCYRLRKPAEVGLLFLATLATQGSALRWSCLHRMHHKFADKPGDPYGVHEGFWHAHWLWIFKKDEPLDFERWAPDLLQNRLVMFQHRYYVPLSIIANVAVFIPLGVLLGDIWGAIVIAWGLRLLVAWHLTWFVNSLAHYWGEKTYSKEQSAVDNAIVAFLTVGEGYHNYHHTFQADYRNGVRWYHFDPVKWVIWCLSKLGLASHLSRYEKHRIQQRLFAEDRKLLLARLDRIDGAQGSALRRRVNDRFESLQFMVQKTHANAQKRRELRRELRRVRGTADEASCRELLAKTRRAYRMTRHGLRECRRAWEELCDEVLNCA